MVFDRVPDATRTSLLVRVVLGMLLATYSDSHVRSYSSVVASRPAMLLDRLDITADICPPPAVLSGRPNALDT